MRHGRGFPIRPHITPLRSYSNDRYWVGGSATWNFTAGSKWSTTSGGPGGAAVPTTGDRVFFDANSGAVTVTYPAASGFIIGSVDWTGFTGTFNAVPDPSATSLGVTTHVRFGSAMTFTGSLWLFWSSVTADVILETRGVTMPGVVLPALNSPYTWKLIGNLNLPSDSGDITSGLFNPSGTGTFDLNGYNVTCRSYTAQGSGSTHYLRGGTITLQQSAGGAASSVSVASNIGTFDAGTSTIKFTDSSNVNGTFAGGGKTFYQVWISRGASTAHTTITGSNTYDDFKYDPGSIIWVTDATTQTILTSMTSSGTGSTITSTTTATHTWSKASGTISIFGTTLSYSIATGGAIFYALTSNNNVDGGNNTGWIFVIPMFLNKYLGMPRAVRVASMMRLYAKEPHLNYPGKPGIYYYRSWTNTSTETITETDTVIKTDSRTLTETITESDVFAYLKLTVKTLTDTITETDTLIRSIVRTLTETITETDTLIKTLSRALTETITQADTLIKITSRTLTETITESDVFSYLRVTVKTLTETITETDTFISISQFFRTMTETITETDVLTTLRTAFNTLTETITMADTLLKRAGKVLTETITETDVFAYFHLLGITLTETITQTDTLIRVTARALLETITQTDTLLKKAIKTFTETITQTDVFTYLRSAFKTLTETITETDVLSTLKLYVRELVETIHLTDIYTMIITIYATKRRNFIKNVKSGVAGVQGSRKVKGFIKAVKSGVAGITGTRQ